MTKSLRLIFTAILLASTLAGAEFLPFSTSCEVLLLPGDIKSKVVKLLYRDKRIQEQVWMLEKFGMQADAVKAKAKLKKTLETADVVSMTLVTGSHFTEVYEVVLKGGLKAIFKPEPKYWKHTKTIESYLSNMDAEITAYEVAEVLGIPVPMTIERKIEGMKGSLQAFVSIGDGVAYSNRTQYYSESTEARNLITIFDYLIGNTDRDKLKGNKNYLIWSVNGFLSAAAYDHSMAFIRPGFPNGRFPTMTWMIHWNEKGVDTLMNDIKEKLTPEVYKAIMKRRKHSNEVIEKRLQAREVLLKDYEDAKQK